MRFTPKQWSLIVAGGLIVALTLGQRHAQGLYLLPVTQDFHLSREAFSFAIAVQNILWGLGAPFAGMLADRYGSGKVLAGGSLLYVMGMGLMPASNTGPLFTLSAGMLIGLGMAGSTWTVNGPIGRGMPDRGRSTALGIVASFGAFGQFLMLPVTLWLINGLGWMQALWVVAGMVALTLPLCALLAERPGPSPVVARSEGSGFGAESDSISMGRMWRLAITDRSLWMLWLGFTACGFQLAFIQTHLPTFLIDRGLTPRDGTLALALVGLFNIVGTMFFGRLADTRTKKYVIAWIYALRTLCIAVFLLLPLSSLSVYVFASAMGFLWLGIGPAVTGLVAQMFGVRYLASLFGFVFLGHQVGSFLGVWLGGLFFDRTGSYMSVWILAIAIGSFAALVSLPIDERSKLVTA